MQNDLARQIFLQEDENKPKPVVEIFSSSLALRCGRKNFCLLHVDCEGLAQYTYSQVLYGGRFLKYCHQIPNLNIQLLFLALKNVAFFHRFSFTLRKILSKDMPEQRLWNLTISPFCLAFSVSVVVYSILLGTENCDELGHIYKPL